MIQDDFLKELGIDAETIETEVNKTLSQYPDDILAKLYETTVKEFKPDTIVKAKIVNLIGDDVMVDVGYKSEGIIPLSEFGPKAEVKIGDEIEVLVERIEPETDYLILSKLKADRMKAWERIIQTSKEGDTVKGRVVRRVKGGLMVDIGIMAFLPASQVDIRRLENLDKFINKEIEATIIKIDPSRMSVTISRRRFLENQRLVDGQKLLAELKEGDVREGIVKNIADYGVFVDLGGIDGLLHISDMSWRRISHPSEMVVLDQPIKVKILKIEQSSGRITLGLKQLTPNPWEEVLVKYPIGTRVKGKVVNLVPYGAFIEIEPGLEGLLHISEMSWTRRIDQPSDILAIGDMVEVMVLNINPETQELALGMKQLEENPWTQVAKKYAPGMRIQGRVRNLTNYGAFIEIEEGIDGLLHISDMSWTRKISRPAEVIKKGDKIEVVILSIEPEKKRIALGLKQLIPNPWDSVIPEKYPVGTVVVGKVTALTSAGAVVELAKQIEGIIPQPRKARLPQTTPEAAGITPGEKTKVPGPPSDYKPKIDDQITVEIVELVPEEGYIGLRLVKPPDQI